MLDAVTLQCPAAGRAGKKYLKMSSDIIKFKAQDQTFVNRVKTEDFLFLLNMFKGHLFF